MVCCFWQFPKHTFSINNANLMKNFEPDTHRIEIDFFFGGERKHISWFFVALFYFSSPWSGCSASRSVTIEASFRSETRATSRYNHPIKIWWATTERLPGQFTGSLEKWWSISFDRNKLLRHASRDLLINIPKSSDFFPILFGDIVVAIVWANEQSERRVCVWWQDKVII